jgi:hypothetical protein
MEIWNKWKLDEINQMDFQLSIQKLNQVDP